MVLRRICVGCIVLFFACIGRSLADDACWQRLYDLIEHNASSPHPTFTSYAEHGTIIEDDAPLLRFSQNVVYRDDGVAVINDSRWSNPIISNSVEPGPPLLGPYGTYRSVWLAQDENAPFPVIGNVRTHPRRTCITSENQNYAGRNTTRLDFPDAPTDRPTLQSLWFDPRSSEVLKVVVSGQVNFATVGTDPAPHLAEFQVEFEDIGAYTVVRHVTWRYAVKVFSQHATLFGEYYMDDYSFSDHAPSSVIGDLGKR